MRTLLFQNEDDLRMVTDQEHLALFYDKGVLPDGNALLPREPVPIDGYEALIKTGRAAFIEAFYRDSLELITGLSLPHSVWLNAEMTGHWWMFKYAIQESVGLWAHFGTYGGRDEVWVVAKKEHAGRRREGAAAAPECQGQGSAEKKFGDKDIPIVKCFKVGGNVEFWCPFCHCWHTHFARGEWEGWIQPYCTPFKYTGYFLMPYTEGELKRIREKAEG